MKFIAIAFVLLFVGICALPQDEVTLDGVEARITVTNRIQKAVDELNRNLVERGLDSVEIADKSFSLLTPIGRAEAHVKGLKCTGIAQNRFNRLSFNTITMRLNFELEWPRIGCELKSSGVSVAVLGRGFEVSASGSLELINTSLGGSVRVRARPISGVSIIDCDLVPDTNIQSNLNVKWQGRDISDKINGKVEVTNEIVQASKVEVGRRVCEILEQVL